MFREILGIIKDFIYRVLKSRLFPVAILFGIMFLVLVVRLFNLQILESEKHQNDYVQMSLTELTTDAVRGNIYDKNGTLLAYDQMVYSVTLKDIGFYEKNAEKNQMILELIHLLDECDQEINVNIPIAMAGNGTRLKYMFTTTSETRKKQFLRDVYGCSLSQIDDESGKYPSNITADKAIELLKEKYYFKKWLEADPDNIITISDYDALRVINIRYALAQNVYKKYMSITIASNVSETTMATIKENAMQFQGVDIEEDYVRVYPDGEYFAQIVGYTGIGSTDEIDQLKVKNSSYEYGDTIGKSGIEALMETELSGTKGSMTVYLDSTGKILQVLEETPATVGKDIYLTIDHDLTIASYKLLEQEMASIILTVLVNEEPEDVADSDVVKIPIKKIYYQLFNNNVLSLEQLERSDAPWWETDMLDAIERERNKIIKLYHDQILSDADSPMEKLSEDELEYMDFLVSFLCNDSGLLDGAKIDKDSDVYTELVEHTGSLKKFLYNEITRSSAINLSDFVADEEYYSNDKVYSLIGDELLSMLSINKSLETLIVENMIYSDLLDPYLICLTMYSQGIIEKNEAKMKELVGADKTACFNFIGECIGNIELTPAQIALDPCNGAVVITDVNNGKVLAEVSYPSYDNNLFSGSIDAAYYRKLLNDKSNPLFNYATQARSAPGSTFKMVSAIAALETGIMKKNTEVDCLGIFDLVQPSAKCWIYSNNGVGHGNQNIVKAIANSCNYYFYNIGYELSLEPDGTYNESQGLERLQHYANLMGLGEKSGIELNEYAPQISTEYPVTTAIGQATNNYTAVQLSRYVTAIASKGNLYDLTLLDHEENKKKEILKTFDKDYKHIGEIHDDTWNIIQEGMYEVTHSGTVVQYFKESDFNVCGKTGSAQEDLSRPNHAWFVSFGPSEEPEITVTCYIRNGYSSGYCAGLANDIYNYHFGYTTLDSIIKSSTGQDNSSVSGD